MIQINKFAETHSLRVRRSRTDHSETIIGKYGEIYEYDDDRLGVMVLPAPPRRGVWVRSRGKFLAIGMAIVQNGDEEGAATFDPADPEQAKAAIQAIQVKKVQKLSPERLAKLLVAGEATRLKAGYTAQNGL